jgi:hypothetical protein
MVVMKTEMRFLNNNKIKGNEVLMLVILNCTLLHNQNGGWTVPYAYVMFCCKTIYLRMLFKEAYNTFTTGFLTKLSRVSFNFLPSESNVFRNCIMVIHNF